MDEVHLDVQHAESFREECRRLTTLFFRPVFHPPSGVCTVRLFAMTATLPQPYVASLALLVTLRFPPRAVVRGTPTEFAQREIRMRQRVVLKRDYVTCGRAAWATLSLS